MTHEGFEIRPVPGFPGYHARIDGVVYSERSKRKGVVNLHPLKPQIQSDDYPTLNLVDASGRTRRVRLHRAMLEAFVGPRLKGYEARHLDSDKLNNHIRNLAWGTKAENGADVAQSGMRKGRPRNTLSEDDVREIRRKCANGASSASLARKYGVYPQAISKIRHRRTWAKVVA